MNLDSASAATIDEEARRRFELAWRQKNPQPIEEFLPAPDTPRYLSTLEELVQIDLEMRWKNRASGPAPRLEEYLERFPLLARPEILRRLLAEEFRIRHLHGDRPDAAEFRKRFPDLAPTLDRMQNVTPSRSGYGSALPTIEGYEITEVLGKGGMGVVYKARHHRLNRFVAIKTVYGGADSAELLRFLNEAAAIAHLQHPNIVQIHDVNETGDLPFFTMEFVGGGTLAHKLKGGVVLPPREAAFILEQVSRAVEYAHGRGVVHRDLKPANILLSRKNLETESVPRPTDSQISIIDFVPKVADFGLAKLMDLGSGLTQTGAIVGTPNYMAPEQAAGRSHLVGPATDIHALGAILYELITGRPPFQGPTVMDTLEQVRSQDPVPPSQLQPRTPLDLETICMKCLRKEPERRYLSVGELADDLGRFLRGETIRARPTGRGERFRRWCWRNPMVAGLTAMIALLLVGATIAATAAAVHLEFVAQREAGARRQAEDQEGIANDKTREAERQHREAEDARKESEKTLERMFTQSGLTAQSRGEPAEAILWFTRSMQLERNDPEIGLANRVRFRSWSRMLAMPARAFSHEGRIWHTAIHPKGTHLLTIMNTGVLAVWDIEGERKIEWPTASDVVTAAEWTPDGSHLIVGTRSGQVDIRAFPGGVSKSAIAFPGGIRTLAISGDGRWLALGGKAARIWNLETGCFASPEFPHPATVQTIAFSPEGDYLLTGAEDDKARFFNLPERDATIPEAAIPHRSFKPKYSSSPMRPAFLKKGREVLTVLDDQDVGWWDATTGKNLRTVSFGTPPFGPLVLALAANSDSTRFAVGGFNGGRIWNADDAKMLNTVLVHINYITAMSVSPDGRVLLTASEDRTCRLWSMEDGKPLGPSLAHQASLLHTAFFPDGRRFVTVQSDGLVRVWDVPKGHPDDRKMPIAGYPTSARIASTGRYVLPAGGNWRDGTLRSMRVFEVASGQPAGPELPLGGLLVNAAISPHGTQALTACSLAPTRAERDASRVEPLGKAGRVQFWNWQTGERLFDPIPMPSEPRGVNFSPDGSSAAAMCNGGQLFVFDTATGKTVHRLFHGSYGVQNSYPSVRYTPDGKSLISWGCSAHARVWDLESGKERFDSLKHDSLCYYAVPSHDGRLLVTGSWDHTARVWDLTTGKLLATLHHPEWVFSAGFDRNAECVLTACRDGMARVWDWKRESLSHPPCRHGDAVFSAEFTGDERFIVTACRDGNVRIWHRPTARLVAPPFLLRFGRWNWAAPNPEDRGFDAWNADVTPDGAKALVGGTAPALYSLHLGDLTGNDPLPLDDPMLLGEILSGFRLVDDHQVEGLTSSDWMDRWRRFRKQHPEFGSNSL